VFKRLIFRVVGSPPAPGSDQEARLRWIRRFYRLNLIAIAIVVIVALVTGSSFLWVLAAVVALMWAGGVLRITWSIRRAHAGLSDRS
jgi:FtsH-binding integral membrane protein